MNATIQAIIIFVVAIVLTVASLIIAQVYQDRDKDILASGFMGLAVVLGLMVLVSAVCVIGTIWPQS